MYKERASQLLTRLRSLKKPMPYYGICTNINMYYKECKGLVEDWPHFSGDVEYPIPSTKSDINQAVIYKEMAMKKQLWDRRTKYGRLRWDLVDHLIRKLVKIYGE